MCSDSLIQSDPVVGFRQIDGVFRFGDDWLKVGDADGAQKKSPTKPSGQSVKHKENPTRHTGWDTPRYTTFFSTIGRFSSTRAQPSDDRSSVS